MDYFFVLAGFKSDHFVLNCCNLSCCNCKCVVNVLFYSLHKGAKVNR